MDSVPPTSVAVTTIAAAPTRKNGSGAPESDSVMVAIASGDRLRTRRIAAILEADGIRIGPQALSAEAICEFAEMLVDAVVVICGNITEPSSVAGVRRIRAQ